MSPRGPEAPLQLQLMLQTNASELTQIAVWLQAQAGASGGTIGRIGVCPTR